MDFTHVLRTAPELTEQTGEQRYKGDANERHAAASHELLHALAFSRGIVVAIALHEIDHTPDAETCTKGYYEGLENSYCAVKKCHIPCCRNPVGVLLKCVFSPVCKSRNRMFQHLHGN